MSYRHYIVYGDQIASSIPLPELRETDPGRVRWTFDVADSLPDMEDTDLLGEETIYDEISARLFKHRDGHRILIDDTGVFDISGDRARIRWIPTADPWWDFGRAHLLGRVLATALQLDGVPTLHGSAVELAEGVVTFLAPKHFGKSTLSMTLFHAGARFVTDDSLPVRPGDANGTGDERVTLALPGVQSLRVRPGDPDAERLVGHPIDVAPGRDGKVTLPPLPAQRVLQRPVPLAAIYLLSPIETNGATEEPAAARDLLPPIPSALFLIGQTRIGSMLGKSFASEVLDAMTRIAETVPVYRLRVVRGMDRLPEVVDTILSWHGGLPALRTESESVTAPEEAS